jgi:hypothetical protein
VKQKCYEQGTSPFKDAPLLIEGDISWSRISPLKEE